MIKAPARTLREDALRRVSRIGQDLTRVHERERLLERAASGLIHDLSYKGAFVITEALKQASGPANKFDRTPDQVTVPIKFDREVLGTIVIPMTAGRRITDANREILDIFAEFLGIGLNNMRHDTGKPSSPLRLRAGVGVARAVTTRDKRKAESS